MDTIDYDGRMPYRKKSKKKAPAKSNHKHRFEPCVFEYDGLRLDKAHGFVPEPEEKIGSYCPECGKISWSSLDSWYEWEPLFPGSRSGHSVPTLAALKELNQNTRSLPTFHLEEGVFQKYVEV